MIDAPGRALALDLGSERIGVAVSDSDRRVATPLEVIAARDRSAADQRIHELVEEWEATVIVVGLPLNLDGSEGPAARTVRAIIKRLGATISAPIVTYDERLTTVTAHRVLDDQFVDGRRRREMVDMVAAQVILQAWLDKESHEWN